MTLLQSSKCGRKFIPTFIALNCFFVYPLKALMANTLVDDWGEKNPCRRSKERKNNSTCFFLSLFQKCNPRQSPTFCGDEIRCLSLRVTMCSKHCRLRFSRNFISTLCEAQCCRSVNWMWREHCWQWYSITRRYLHNSNAVVSKLMLFVSIQLN